MLKNREEIQIKDKWDIEKIYSSPKTFQDEYLLMSPKDQINRWNDLLVFKGNLNKSKKSLKECLDKYFNYLRKLEKLYTYSHLLLDQDLSNDEAKHYYGLISNLYSEFQTSFSWLEPEILQIEEKILNEYVQDKELKEYSFYLKNLIRLKPHTLSKEEERILSRANQSLEVTRLVFSSFNNADLKFDDVLDSDNNKHHLSHGTYLVYLKSEDRVLRKNAFENMHKKYFDFQRSLTELFYGEIKNSSFISETRKYDNPLESFLYPNNIDTEVYLNLIKTVKENISTLHKFVSLRKKKLKLDKVHIYDLYVPISDEVEIRYSYEEAKALVLDSVAPLGAEYQQLLKKGLNEERWVDVFETKNKRSGAYSSGCYDSMPYILLNYQGQLNDVLTLAHEAGHSMHTLLANNNQSYLYSRYPIFLAEIASTFNEQLLLDLLMKKAKNEKEKNYLITVMLDRINATLFRQTLFAEFELEMNNLHKDGQPITSALIKSKYEELYKFYYGKDFEVDNLLQMEWARIPHFYSPFYVYQYSIGISIALYAFIKTKQDAGFTEKYLSILKKGGSDYPMAILKQSDIDITKSSCIDMTIKYFNELIEKII
ncbi:MAG: oligoendopeptidase F [Parachlamydiales bacterium]|jgi:oligoendopeptidase F